MAAVTSTILAAAALAGSAYTIYSTERARGEAEEEGKKQEAAQNRLIAEEEKNKRVSLQSKETDAKRQRQVSGALASGSSNKSILSGLGGSANTKNLLGL